MRALSLPVVHMLLVLTEGERHGYAIKQEVERRTDGDIRLGPGTLYEAIQRLEAEGLIEATPPAGGEQTPRRRYRLTEAGLAALRIELRRFGAVIDRARSSAPGLIDPS
jgi:DNA-binding PadR family transcriptional regulator